MSEMVERVARAMCTGGRDADYVGGGFHPSGCELDAGEPWWEGYAYQARAAIEAMREPTEAMQRAWLGPEPWDHEALEVWQAMIDAALKESP